MDNINYYRLLSIFLDFNMNSNTSLIYKILTLLSNSSALSPRVQKYFFNSTARLNLVEPEEKISRENEILARFVDWIERGKGLCRKRVALSLANLKIFDNRYRRPHRGGRCPLPPDISRPRKYYFSYIMRA